MCTGYLLVVHSSWLCYCCSIVACQKNLNLNQRALLWLRWLGLPACDCLSDGLHLVCHAADLPSSSSSCTSFGGWLCLLSLLLLLLAQSSLLRRLVNVSFSHVCHTARLTPLCPSHSASLAASQSVFVCLVKIEEDRATCDPNWEYEEIWRGLHTWCAPITIDGSFMKAQLKCVWWAFSISLGNNLLTPGKKKVRLDTKRFIQAVKRLYLI